MDSYNIIIIFQGLGIAENVLRHCLGWVIFVHIIILYVICFLSKIYKNCTDIVKNIRERMKNYCAEKENTWEWFVLKI